MLRVLVVDDEPLARGRVMRLLSPRDDVEIVGEAHSVKTAVELIDRTQPDLVFLDIELKDGSGFDVFDRTLVKAHVVFVTAYSEHALRAFDVQALDYIVKPFGLEQLERALARVHEGAPPPSSAARTGRLLSEHRVYLKEPKNLRCCRVADIVSVHATVGYTDVRLADGDIVLVREPLQSWEMKLPTSFVRIHRSTMINLDYLEALVLVADGWQVRLRTVEHPLSVSRRCLQSVKDHLESVEP